MAFSSSEVSQLNSFLGFLSYKFTWVFKKFLQCPQGIILQVYGNQSGKTGGTAFQYVLRILGKHPIPEKNVVYFECPDADEHSWKTAKYGDKEVKLYRKGRYGAGWMPKDKCCKECGKPLVEHERSCKTYRFCSQTLPGQTTNVDIDGGAAEVKNTQYPEFKKWLPSVLIKKDITVRNTALIIADPFGGKDIVVEFVSYSQSTASTAGVQRLGIWFDEAPPYDFYEEQVPRLLAENGDMLFTYTPVDRGSWLFDEFYDKAQVLIRTDAICKFLSDKDYTVPNIEVTDNPYDIAVLMAATDDNPTLNPVAIEAKYAHIEDPDVVAIRRYGIFKQLSGRIFKEFEYAIHYLDAHKYFPDGIPKSYVHARGIDYHPQTAWACGMMAISPENEAFIWGAYNPSPEKYTTAEIAEQFALLGQDYKFRLNLIDPLSVSVKKDFKSVLGDLNDSFRLLKREGIGTGGVWSTWDTHGEHGRDEIHRRLKNAKQLKTPFNNRVLVRGVEKYLPTIWVLNTCPMVAKHMKNWRWEQWADTKATMTKEEKNKPEQKWSHFNMVWEAIFKNPAFRPHKKDYGINRRKAPGYFTRRR